MANGFKLRLDSIVSDGTNLYCSVTMDDGLHAYPPISPVFPAAATASQIDAYMQNIVDSGPALANSISELVGKTYTGA